MILSRHDSLLQPWLSSAIIAFQRHRGYLAPGENQNKAGYDEAQIELTILEPPSVFTEREVFELTAGESFTVDLDIGGTPTPKERSKSISVGSTQVTGGTLVGGTVVSFFER